jgi:hypothetical protein
MLLPALVTITSLGSAATAHAASLADVSTGPAKQVSYGSAVLTGAVDPKGSNTSYYFQYGPTSYLGGQTTINSTGGANAVQVSVPVTGLQPVTLYHFRLVAVNSAGAAIGKTRTFLTPKVPLSVQIAPTPNPAEYGGAVVVQGTVSGTENTNREVELLAEPWPFTEGFQVSASPPELTTATGGFSFALFALPQNTRFEVMTVTHPPVVSPVVEEDVAVRVESHVARARRPHHVRIYGTVTPAENGMQVGVLREVHGHGVLMGGTGLVARNATTSKYSVVVPAKRGVYRVLVRITSGAQASNYGRPMMIG